MAGYFGTPEQQRLQTRAEENAVWVAATPGACNSGRFIGCDDVDRLGWERIEEIMRRDGAIGFRLLPKERVPEVADWMTARGYRIDFWDPFIGQRDEVLRAARDILSTPLPQGLEVGPIPREPTGSHTQAIQQLMSDNGVAPYSGSMLVGDSRMERAAVAEAAWPDRASKEGETAGVSSVDDLTYYAAKKPVTKLDARQDSPQTCHKLKRATPDNRGFLRVSADSYLVAKMSKNGSLSKRIYI